MGGKLPVRRFLRQRIAAGKCEQATQGDHGPQTRECHTDSHEGVGQVYRVEQQAWSQGEVAARDSPGFQWLRRRTDSEQ